MIESDYIGKKNCSDEIYETENIERAYNIIIAICNELIKLDLYRIDCLNDDELIIGLDTGPYNFIMKSGRAYYVDFYPPRHRIANGKRLTNSEIVTDYPSPRDKEHGNHLIYCFYNRNGLWTHALSHLLAALDSNENLKEIWIDKEQDILVQVYKLINNAGLYERVEILKKDLASPKSKFNNFRKRFFNHRSHYYKNKNKGFYLSKSKQLNNVIRKFYLADKSGIPFTQKEGMKMLNDCNRYFSILKNDIGMTVPCTEIKLISIESE